MHQLGDLLPLQRVLELSEKYRTELILLVVVLVEGLNHVNLRRYWSRSFLSDALHVVFYVGGIGALLFFNPMLNALEPHVSWFRLGLVSNLPPLPAFLLFFVWSDFVNYWFHRWQHRSPYLWVFHSVHHSASHMTGATSFRRHLGETVVGTLLKYFVVILPMLGVLRAPWLPTVGLLILAIEFNVILQHAELDWHYGPFSRLLVSPVFHSVHHSVDEAHHDKNFGMILSIWDHLFGTALEVEHRSGTYGLDERAGVPDTFHGQVIAPFKMFFDLLKRRRTSEPVAP